MDARRVKRLTLVASILGSSVVFLDGSVVNVALPAIRDDLHAGLATQQWVVEVYLLTLASLLLIGGSLGDALGQRRVFEAGLWGFGATSLLCAIAPGAALLVAARALQGVAGALLVPSSLALIAAFFEEEERGAAVGSWTAWTGVSFVVGPLAGGLLIEALSWRLVFAINIPLVLVTVALARGIPDSGAAEREPLDLVGAALCMLGLAGPTFGLTEESRYGLAHPLVWAPIAVGLACLAAFVAHEARTPHPMLPLELFRRRGFSVANLTTLTLYAGLGALTFFLVIFLQQVAGYDAVQAGLATLPITVVMFALSKRFGRLSARIGPRLVMGFGPLVAACGLLLMLRVDADVSYATQLFPGVVVFGLGLSMTVAPLTTTVLQSVEPWHAGVASGTNNAISRLAGMLGIAIVGAVVAAQFSSTLDSRVAGGALDAAAARAVDDAKAAPLAGSRSVPQAERAQIGSDVDAASVDAFRSGLTASAALVALGGAVALAGLRRPRPALAPEVVPATVHAPAQCVACEAPHAAEPALSRADQA
ncbi:MAG: MFS transporter [Thermoleophilaceae bacterium]|nr:MFS transporter [Thermoleophilaceae bacterium]